MRRPRPLALALLLAAAAAAACGSPVPRGADDEPAPEIPGLSAQAVAARRAEQNASFRTDPGSPIPVEQREAFRGLDFYPFDPTMRFVVRLERYDDPEPQRMVTTEGDVRPGVRMGRVRFEHDGAEHVLQVYLLRDAPAEAWGKPFLPFMDMTTGTETYGAGRYVDLAPGPGDWYLLDFNLAYNPHCAYGRTGYACPKAPGENRLPFAVRAGERGPKAVARAEPGGDAG